MKQVSLFFALALLLSGCGSDAPVEVGQVLANFKLKALDGSEYSSSSHSDGPIIINFWATWCQPCLKELPALIAIHEQAKAQVIGIALDEGGAAPVNKFVKKNGINYTVLLGNQEIFRKLDGYAIPYTLILDTSGKIVNIHRGPATLEALEKDLASIGVSTATIVKKVSLE